MTRVPSRGPIDLAGIYRFAFCYFFCLKLDTSLWVSNTFCKDQIVAVHKVLRVRVALNRMARFVPARRGKKHLLRGAGVELAAFTYAGSAPAAALASSTKTLVAAAAAGG